jgi:hypothetical protein
MPDARIALVEATPLGQEYFDDKKDSLAITFERMMLARIRRFADSLLEGTGSELTVPVRQAKLMRSCR